MTRLFFYADSHLCDLDMRFDVFQLPSLLFWMSLDGHFAVVWSLSSLPKYTTQNVNRVVTPATLLSYANLTAKIIHRGQCDRTGLPLGLIPRLAGMFVFRINLD